MRLIRHSRKVGLPPGSLVYTGAETKAKVHLKVMDYDEKHLEERKLSVKELTTFKRKKSVSWINIDGIHDTKAVQAAGEAFKLHPLLMEDILSTDQRPKYEEYDDHVYIVLRMLQYNEKRHVVGSEQLSLVLGKSYVLSFQESKEDLFDMVRERLRNGKSRLRKRGADYLAYALIDAVVDGYFLILEHFGDDVEKLEEELLENTDDEVVHRINALKREAIYLRRSTWPLREAISGLQHGSASMISNSTKPFLRDVYDHTIHVIDTIETYRDMVSGMTELHMTSVSNKMNEVMKVLTIIATIFIPLTFITGVYGMNFDVMPELRWANGYYYMLGFMVLIFIGQLWYFKRKKWL